MKLFGGKDNAFFGKVESFFKGVKSFFDSMSRKHKIIIAICLVALAVIITVAALVIGGVKSPVPTDVDKPESKPAMESQIIPEGDEIEVEGRSHKEDFITVLIIGTDDGGWNTDTIMLAAFDISAGKLNVLSIPRDTIVNVKRSNKKINAALSSGGKAKNVDELKEEVESVTGIMPDKYAIVELDGFIDMIDAIGGVTVDVPIDMVYNDPAQDLTINIKKGIRTLDGYDSMGFMRYRKTYVEGDVGRIKVQQTFIKALVDKMLTPSTLTKIPKLAQIVFDNVDTDLTLGNIVWLGKEAIKMSPSTDIQTFLMPGEGAYYQRLSYFFPYEAQVIELVNEHFNPYVKDIKNINVFDPRGEEEAAQASSEKAPVEEVPLEQEITQPVEQTPVEQVPVEPAPPVEPEVEEIVPPQESLPEVDNPPVEENVQQSPDSEDVNTDAPVQEQPTVEDTAADETEAPVEAPETNTEQSAIPEDFYES